MAIVILSEPSGVLSAYAPLIIKAIDTVPASYDPTMVATIEVDDGTGRWVNFGDKSQGKYRNSEFFQFELSSIVQRAITHDYPNQSGSAILLDNLNSSASVRVALEYFEPDGDGVLQSVSTATSTAFTVNSTIAEDITNTALTEYILNDDGSKLFLTKEKTQRISDGEHLQFHFLWDEAQLGTDATVRSYPLVGSPSNASVAITAFDYSTNVFNGIDGDTLTSTPTSTLVNAALARVTGSDGLEWVGVEIDDSATDSFQVANTNVGDKVNFEVFARVAGNIKLTWVGGVGSETFAMSVGYNEFTSVVIPASTTAIKFENLTTSNIYVVWANTIEASYSTIVENRGILYIDEYDSTLEKIEIWINNDSSQITETLTVFMDGCKSGKRLSWKAKSGTMEHYTFRGADNTQRDVLKNKILSEAVEPIGETRGFRTTHAQSIDTTTVFTDFHDGDTLEWLSEIAESPEVYLVNAYNDRTPVDIITTSFPTQGKELRQGTLSYRPTFYNKIQNG